MRKQNLGKATKQLEKYKVPHFGVGYVTQSALGGHSIPIDAGALQTLVILGAVTESEAAKHTAPGLERAIPKSKGVEFGSLLHQLGADLHAAPHGPKARKIILEIDASAKDRLPKRTRKTKAVTNGEGTKKKSSAKTKKKAKAVVKKASPAGKKKATGGKKSASKKLARKKPR